tara:strand:+ start:75 stop:617 length:543 start_codon:yes stop_codon:yes gene_type:complete
MDEMDKMRESVSLVIEEENEIESKLDKKYCLNDERGTSQYVLQIMSQLARIYQAVDNEIEGRKILDLGCGEVSGNEWDKPGSHTFEPWLCRSLIELGASPVGVDIGDNPKAEFEFYKVNLASPNSLSFLEDNSIDVANANMLFDSPYLHYHLHMKGKTLKENLIPQLERIIKPNGVFLHD